jgi:PPIC-type PPIASE domain
MLRRIVKEPLTHFLALALVIFVAYGLLNPSERKRPDRIVITGAKIEQLAAFFTSTWQRSPTVSELKGLVDDYLKEEIYYREALALGLDKDDTIIRRRLRNKMEFLNQAEAEAALPTPAELEAFLKANPKKFEIEPAIAFRHVFLSPDKRGAKIGVDAAALLTRLLSNADVALDTLGDGTLLPDELPLTGKAAIGQIFGPEFADALDLVMPGKWAGPIKSAFGVHIVLVSERQPSRNPAVGEVRDAVAREWANEKRIAIDEARISTLLRRYDVIIENPSQPKANR